MAGALGVAGVASLRCDDRGVGGSTGEFGAATLATFVADAQAAVAALRRERALAAELSTLGLAYLHVVDHSSMGAPKVSDAVKAALRTGFKGTYVLSGGYDRARAEADEWAGGEAWLRSHMRHDALADVRALACPVWIAQGAIDRQVTPVDAAALAGAARAGGRATVTERAFASLDHAFVVSATGDVADYATPGRQVDPTFLAELAGFVAAVPPRPR